MEKFFKKKFGYFKTLYYLCTRFQGFIPVFALNDGGVAQLVRASDS